MTTEEIINSLNRENRDRIRNIILNNNLNQREKKIELMRVEVEYLRKYCYDEEKTVTFTIGIEEKVVNLGGHIGKKDFVDIILDDFSFHPIVENSSFINLMNECFSRRLLVKEEKNFYAYSKNNLKK